MNNAFWYLSVKSIDDDQRTFEGIASTPTVDRMGDILEPKGVKYSLPVPLMWEHGKSGEINHPVGWVTEVKVRGDGIAVKGKFAKVSEPPSLKESLDKAWALAKNKLVRGLSVGFNPIDSEPIKNSYGLRFTSWELLELSPVSIAANAESMFTNFKSMGDFEAALTVKPHDKGRPAVSGNKAFEVLRLDKSQPSGVPVITTGKSMKPTTEVISEWEAKHLATSEKMAAIMNKSTEENRDLTADEESEYDGLKEDKERQLKHIERLQQHEQTMRATAKPISKAAPLSDNHAATQRSGVQYVRSNAPRGIFPARMAIAMIRANNNPYYAAQLCEKHWPDMPELALTCKAIVEAADTTTSGWASQLVPAAQQLQDEFLDIFRASTIIDRIPGIRRVPFNVAVPIRSGVGTFQWVGEAKPKPVTSETFTNVTLRFEKAAAIIVITQELARFSSPSAELLIRDSMVQTLTRFFDSHFVSTTAAVSNVSPAGILNGISATTPSGTTAAALRSDMNNLLNNFTANNVPLSGIVLLMSSTTAVALSLMVTDLGVNLFPGITAQGGNFLGFPVVVSEAVGTKIIAVYAPDILLAEDPAVNVTASDQATIEMDTAPAVGEQSPPSDQSVLKSMFQNNMIAIRAEQFKTWTRARTASVEYINLPAYVPGT